MPARKKKPPFSPFATPSCSLLFLVFPLVGLACLSPAAKANQTHGWILAHLLLAQHTPHHLVSLSPVRSLSPSCAHAVRTCQLGWHCRSNRPPRRRGRHSGRRVAHTCTSAGRCYFDVSVGTYPVTVRPQRGWEEEKKGWQLDAGNSTYRRDDTARFCHAAGGTAARHLIVKVHVTQA